MSFIWHTALSLIDLGSSLIYNLLGRDLNENDIKIIEFVFNYVSKTHLQINSQSSLNVSTCNQLKQLLDSDSRQLNNLFNLLCKNINSAQSKDLLLITNKQNGYNLVQTLVQSIIQLSFNILNDNFKLFIDAEYDESNFLTTKLELQFDNIINQRIDLLRVLFKSYSCDPNRGLLLSNKTKYSLSLSDSLNSSPVNTPLKNPVNRRANRQCNDSRRASFYENKSFKSNNVVIDYDVDCSDNLDEDDLNESKTNADQTKVETETLTELTSTFETMVKNKSFNDLNSTTKTLLSSPCLKNTSQIPFSYITNVDLSNVTHFTDEKSINQLNTTSIDTPLLIICCVYNTHNLLSLSNLSNSNKKSNKQVKIQKNNNNRFMSPQVSNELVNSKPSANSMASTIKEKNLRNSFKRRHTIHCDHITDFQKSKKQIISRSNSIKSVKKENSDSYWSSSSGSDTESSSTSSSKSSSSARDSSFSSSSSLSFNSFNSSLISSYSKSLDSISKLFKPSTKSHHNNDYYPSDSPNKEMNESNSDSSEFIDENERGFDTHNQDVTLSEKPNRLENEEDYSDDSSDNSEDVESDDDSGNDYSSNIYDYDLENDEQNYYDKYDYDINSNCCKLNSNNFSDYDHCSKKNHDQKINFSNLETNKLSSLSTSVHSLPSSSNHDTLNKENSNSNTTNNKSTTCSVSTRNAISSKNNFIYQKLNNQRLNLLDLLLKYGADKYLISKLTIRNFKKLNKKSRSLLKKWYGVSTHLKSNHESLSSLSNQTENISNSMPSGLNQENDPSEESDHDNDSYELRPLSPIMASLCLDDVDIFSRLYKHNQLLFNYFKPDEDYELIYYAIKFQSKNCLIYLLTNTSNENLPSLFEHATNKSKISCSLSIPRLKESKSHQINSLPSLNKLEELKKEQKQLNKNVNTMFYILENIRSSKIVKVLLKCGFDLSKREPLTGNTALHCLFNATSSLASQKPCLNSHNSLEFNKKILSEYHDPKSLSRILFIMLKNGGLKTHVNTLNYDRKLCTQVLFEWDELIELVFFKNTFTQTINNQAPLNRSEWQKEFKHCLKLLLKAGADLLLNINNNDVENEGFHNCIETLLNSLLKHSIINLNRASHRVFNNPQTNRNRSPSLPAIIINQSSVLNEPFQFETSLKSNLIKKKKFFYNKTFDIEFLYEILNDVINLDNLTSSLNRANFYHHHHQTTNTSANVHSHQESAHRLPPRDCSTEKYLEILLNTNIDDFASAFDTFKLLCNFQKSLNNKIRSKFNSTNQIKTINPQLVKKLVSNWILYPNFLNSSCQFEKNNFIKSLIIELIQNDLYDPNNSTLYSSPNVSKDQNQAIQSNNLLNHCVQLIFLSKTCYQLELIYDLMRTLIQYGADPNTEPYDFGSTFNYMPTYNSSPSSGHSSPSSHNTNFKHTNSILVQLCEPFTTGRLTPILTTVNLSRSHRKQNLNPSFQNDQQLEYRHSNNNHHHNHNHHHQHHHPHHHHNHHHHHHSHNHDYFEDYFKDRSYTSKTEYSQSHQANNLNDRVIGVSVQNTPIIMNEQNDADYMSRKSNDNLLSPKLSSSNRKLSVPSNPILLLTPSPSYASLLTIASSSTMSSVISNTSSNSSTLSSSYSIKSDNIVIDSSILFLNHHKRFVKLLFDSMETSKINEVVKSRNLSLSPEIPYCHHHHYAHHNMHHRIHHQSIVTNNNQLNQNSLQPNKLYAIESIDMYLERLVSSPRSLKSISRRYVLNRLIETEKKKKENDNNSENLILIINQVSKLPLPKRIKNYLLFIE